MTTPESSSGVVEIVGQSSPLLSLPPRTLRFGIPSLDRMFGTNRHKNEEHGLVYADELGISLFSNTTDRDDLADSPCGSGANSALGELSEITDFETKTDFKTWSNIKDVQAPAVRDRSANPNPAVNTSRDKPLSSALSLCIAGPSGVGKSNLALHLVSRYAADTYRSDTESDGDSPTCVLYASTDLSYSQANRTWTNFKLDCPKNTRAYFERFEEEVLEPECWQDANFPDVVYLEELGITDVPRFLLNPQESPQRFADTKDTATLQERQEDYTKRHGRKVGFINLQSETAGDDWYFLNKIIAEMEEPENGKPRHLLVIDAVEGLETLAGHLDSFGMDRSRRARIAQVIRTASRKCHVVFVVEGGEARDHPEKFVADFVLRLRNEPRNNYERRTIEIEKARGQAHVRGQHPIILRDGIGSSTGSQFNPDDSEEEESYVYVVPSLHLVARRMMWHRGDKLPESPTFQNKQRVAGFGIRYLDSMLREGYGVLTKMDHGLPCATVTALTGDDGTQKSRLGRAFAGRNFAIYARLLQAFVSAFAQGKDPVDLSDNDVHDFYEDLLKARSEAEGSLASASDEEEKGKATKILAECNRQVEKFEGIRKKYQPIIPTPSPGKRGRPKGNPAPDNRNDANKKLRIVQFAANAVLEIYRIISPRAVVYITTQDIDREALIASFRNQVTRYQRRWNRLKKECDLSQDHITVLNDCLTAIMKRGTVCRRLENHDISTPTLFHVIRQCVGRAQETVFYSGGMKAAGEYWKTDNRFREGWRVRVVIEDWKTIQENYADVREDDQFLPFLLFYLCRQGVTTLMVHTRAGLPGTAAEDDHLQSLAQHNLRTWRVSFNDADIVAISPMPPIATDMPSLVRELTWESESLETDLTVDPNLELYAGVREGNPRLVPLRLRLFSESPAYVEYARRLHRLLQVKFPGAEPQDISVLCGGEEIGVNDSSSSYETLRDLCHLQGELRLDHSLVFMVDEFWSVPEEPQNEAVRAAVTPSRLLPLRDYLVEVTNDWWGVDPAADPNRIFQRDCLPSEDSDPPELRRLEFFGQTAGHSPKLLPNADRVPFTANIPFLLCRQKAWEAASQEPLTGHCSDLKVMHVWDRLIQPASANAGVRRTARLTDHKIQERDGTVRTEKFWPQRTLTWRSFLEACHRVAHAWSPREGECAAFNLTRHSAESLSCLTLEVWTSIISESDDPKLQEMVSRLTSREWTQSLQKNASLIDWLSAGDDPGQTPGTTPKEIARLNQNPYLIALYQTLLLLAEVLTTTSLRRMDNPFQEGSPQRAPAVASRVWFTTASGEQGVFDPEDPLIPCPLPGRFATRGDWYLAVARGSRSKRLADRALDLLCSNTANIQRLNAGIGLPTRTLQHTAEGGPIERYQDVMIPLWTMEPDYRSRNKINSLLTAKFQQTASAASAEGQANERERMDIIEHLRTPRGRQMTYSDTHCLGPSPLYPATSGSAETPGEGLNWLWRSRLHDYDRHARIWQSWIVSEIEYLLRLRQDRRGEWTSGFKIYDDIQLNRANNRPAFEGLGHLSSPIRFAQDCEKLLQSLLAATLQKDAPEE